VFLIFVLIRGRDECIYAQLVDVSEFGSPQADSHYKWSSSSDDAEILVLELPILMLF
jgi:hypothetical protein